MNSKKSNEITIKIKCPISEIYKTLEQKELKIADKFTMEDAYFIPEGMDLLKMETRKILSKAILVREIKGKISGKITRKIIFKIKNIDETGNILNQEAVSCEILDIEDAKKLLKAIGYREIMSIEEDNIVYEKDGFELAIKDIKNGEKLIEIETRENEKLDTIEKLIKKVNEIGIPIYTDNYFVKKAEIEFEKTLKNMPREKSCGCIIIENEKVLLVQQTEGHWGFPKGHVEENETEIETAIREVKEETNIDVEVDERQRYSMEYITGKGILKEVVLFIAKRMGGEIKQQESEINKISWLNFEEAIETITYDNTKELFKKVLKEIR